MIGPPYSKEFVQLFLPLINNDYEEKHVKEFLKYCKETSLE